MVDPASAGYVARMTAPREVTDAPDPVVLAARLMEIDSTSGHEGEVIDWMHAFLGEREWYVRRITVSPGRDNLLALPAADSPRGPLVTLSTHLDTVPPFIPPRLADGVLHGRGACDAKGIVAAMTCAAERLRADAVPVALLFVVGEEVTHDGAHAANEFARTFFKDARGPRVLINGEPTESTLAVGTKGAMRVTVRTTGEAAHSAYPHLGRSAIRTLVQLLAELEEIPLPRDELLGETTINIGMISGGVADNVLAPEAEARLMARLVTPADEVWSLVERWVGDRASLERGPTVPPVRLGVLPGFATSVAAYATDIPELGNWGKPHLFGPGSIHVAHRDDEHVKIDELRAAVGAYDKLARGALGVARSAGR